MPSKWRANLLAGLLLLVAGAFLLHELAYPPFARRRIPEAAAPAPGAPAPESLPPAEVAAFRAGPPLKRVQAFYEKESQRVGQVDPDPALTQKRLSLVAHELSAEEIRWLAGQALDRKTEGDARFFAAYLVALSDQPEAVAALSGIALSAIPVSKNERQTAEERMIRGQAVEGIARHCQVPGARDGLLDVVEKQSDEFLRDRAHRGLYTCATGKTLEEQDKEALRKVRGEKR